MLEQFIIYMFMMFWVGGWLLAVGGDGKGQQDVPPPCEPSPLSSILEGTNEDTRP